MRLNPNDPDIYSNLASLQATCADAKYRDGKQAILNANKALKMRGGNVWQVRDTLAAAYAENGDFQKAREWEMKAIEIAAKDKSAKAKDIEEARSRLELYKQGKPCHEEPKKK